MTGVGPTGSDISIWVSLCGAGFPLAHMNHADGMHGVMEPLAREPPDRMEIMIPHWVYNRIAALLAAANAGEYVSDEKIGGYVAAVLEGHARRLNL